MGGKWRGITEAATVTAPPRSRTFATESGKGKEARGAWVAQSVKHLTPAQVTISRFMGSSLPLGSVLTAQSLEPASDSVSISLCPSPAHTLSLSLSKNK